jgi:hypothetical protein
VTGNSSFCETCGIDLPYAGAGEELPRFFSVSMSRSWL